MELVQLLKALGDENRIRILNLLRKGELCVCEIEQILGISQSNASRHLTKLSMHKLVSYEKKAQWIYYKLDKTTMDEHPFIKELLETEIDGIDICSKDIENLEKFKDRGISCVC